MTSWVWIHPEEVEAVSWVRRGDVGVPLPNVGGVPPLPDLPPRAVSGDSGGAPWRRAQEEAGMDDAQSVGSSLGRSSHSSHHSRHSHASSAASRKHSRHSNVERVHANGERHRRKSASSSEALRSSSRQQHALPGTPPCGRGEKRATNAVVDKAEVASMYLDTKQNMLEIIEEGLHMKLELKSIKQKFLSLLENYDNYHQVAPAALPAAMKASTGVPVTDRPLSAPRARVRALYEARRARLQARRSVGGTSGGTGTPGRQRKSAGTAKDSNKENVVGTRGVLKESNTIGCDEKNNNDNRKSSQYCKPHKHCACHPRIAAGSSLLEPIKEEAALRQHPAYTSGLNSGTATSHTLSDLEGEYVTLRSPCGEGAASVEVSMEVDSYSDLYCVAGTPNALYQTRQSPLTTSQQDETSIWVNTTDNLDTLHCPRLGHDETNKENYTPPGSTRRHESPVKYATSNVISELYTSKSISNLKDISHISRVSMTNQTLREQSSGGNISGTLHSTFNYPLHSTLMYPLHSTLNLSGDEASSPRYDHRDSFEEEPRMRCCSDARTTISEPSAVLRKRNLCVPKETSRRSLDDSIVDIRSLQRTTDGRKLTILSTEHERSRRNKSRTARTRRRERLKQREREAALTPVTSREPQLCKEHGLHPTFGGPCIFQTDDSFTMTETSTEDDEEVRPRSSTAVTETDNDSSYLSECVDDFGSNTHTGRAEDYTATYDARNGRMRMLRRQTGQTVLDKPALRAPVGLSESDFLMDVTQKHLSLEATRSSLPDLSALSTTTNSECGDPEADVSEDTLHASQIMKDSDGFWSPNSLDDTVVSNGGGGGRSGSSHSQQRPLSISTSTTTSTTDNTSPESTESRDMPVPVNSPNVTDSGSSRPTTDTYDYVDVPKFEVMGPPVQLPPRHHPNVQVRRRHHPGVRPPCTVGRPASSSSSTAGDVGTDRDTARLETRSEGRGARKCLRYHHDYDSGFSTPGSGRRHILLSDTAGNTRTVVQHSAVARNLQHDRKKQLVKKIKQFSNNFYKSTGNLHIHTLGHF